MKTRSIVLSAILMTAVIPAFAQANSGAQSAKMNQSMQDMPMQQNSSKIKMRMDCMQMGKDMSCAGQTAKATGVIEGIDVTKGTVTIKHQAIASIHWPAMTMTFKAEPPSLLTKLKVGEKVNFTLRPAGMNSTITAITPIR